MSLPITAFFVSALTGLFMFLSYKIIVIRRSEKISIGDGGNEKMHKLIRAQGNLLENSIFGSLLLLIAELQAVSIWITSISALIFVAGRLFHCNAMALEGPGRHRALGMQLTLIAMILLICVNLVYVFV